MKIESHPLLMEEIKSMNKTLQAISEGIQMISSSSSGMTDTHLNNISNHLGMIDTRLSENLAKLERITYSFEIIERLIQEIKDK